MATLQKEIIGNFQTRQEANEVKQAVEAAGINSDKIMVNDFTSTYTEVSALGTTVGPEAGIVTGAFYGGTLGAIFAILQGFYVSTETMLPGQLAVAIFTLIGGVVGAIAAKRIRSENMPQQKLKGNPDIPRRFRLEISGSEEEINQAKQAVLEQQAG